MNSSSLHCRPSLRQPVALALLLLTLTARAAVPFDGGVSGLEALVQEQASGPVAIARPGTDSGAAIAPLLGAGPLSADTAVRIALLNNPGLQVSLAAQGVNISDAALPASPARRQAGQEIALLAAQARQAWTRAVAAAQIARLAAEAKDSAEAGGELARRMARAGNWSKLQQARQQLMLADAAAQLSRARQAAFSEREKLIVVLGLWGAQTSFALPDRLPDLPAQPQELPDVESRVLQQRLDLQLAAAQWARQRASRREPGADALWDAMGNAARAVSAASVSKVAMAALPEPAIQTKPDTAGPLVPNTGRPYNPVVTLNGWTAALAHEQRRQGVPPGRRARGARDGARLQGASVGLQRPVAPGRPSRWSRATACASS
jgi:multidrug efflux system outer membrane protein